MALPKERVKLNVYRSLLEEEKKKNKKFALVGASLFVMGIFTDVAYETALFKVTGNDMMEKSVAYETRPSEVENLISKEPVATVAWENFYENSVFKESKSEINLEELFVADFGI